MSVDATEKSNRECVSCESGTNYSTTTNASSCTAVSTCSGTEYETVAPGVSMDRICVALRECVPGEYISQPYTCLLYTSPSPRD